MPGHESGGGESSQHFTEAMLIDCDQDIRIAGVASMLPSCQRKPTDHGFGCVDRTEGMPARPQGRKHTFTRHGMAPPAGDA